MGLRRGNVNFAVRNLACGLTIKEIFSGKPHS